VGQGSWNVVQNNDDYAAIYLYNGVSLIVPQGVYLTTGELQELQQQGDQGTLNATISQGNLEVTGTAEVVMWGGTLYGWLTVDMGWVEFRGSSQLFVMVGDGANLYDQLWVGGRLYLNQNEGDAARARFVNPAVLSFTASRSWAFAYSATGVTGLLTEADQWNL